MKRGGQQKPLDATYGRLRVVGREGHYALCVCSCGNERRVATSALRLGARKSCGCLAREIASKRLSETSVTHGMTGTPTYTSWQKMLDRCTNPNHKQWHDYGGRGISVCERWRFSFENFLADMGVRPDGTSLDRFPDVNGNYEPRNCRWASRKEQQRNMRSNVLLTAFGETKTLAEWLEDARCAVEKETLRARLRYGFGSEWAITTPPLPRKLRTKEELEELRAIKLMSAASDESTARHRANKRIAQGRYVAGAEADAGEGSSA